MRLCIHPRSYIKIYFFFVFLICFYPFTARCENYPTTPIGVVEKYLMMDYAGKGLDTAGWNELKILTTWFDGPGWDTVMVIDGYKTGKAKISGNKAFVPVQYKVIGLIGGNTWYGLKDKNFTDEARLEVNPTFELVKNNGKWSIKSPQFRPHVSIKAALEALQASYLGSDKYSEDRKELEKTIRIINSISKGKK